jgi:hypothetical protein
LPPDARRRKTNNLSSQLTSVEFLNPSLSRFPPKLFYYVFIPLDLVCLTLQAAGGALSTTSSGESQLGVHLALAGLGLQVAVLVVFCAFFVDYLVRYYRSAGRAKAFGPRLRVFFGFLGLAIVLILARCAYRCYELNEGYSGETIRDEPLFIGLEGVVVVIAVFALVLGHPGVGFRHLNAGVLGAGDGGETGEEK